MRLKAKKSYQDQGKTPSIKNHSETKLSRPNPLITLT